VFFTGFAFMSGWLPAPPRSRGLAIAAVAVLLISLPFAWHVTIGEFAAIKAWRADWRFLIDKTDFGLLRYVHFLALAYLAWLAAGTAGENLNSTPFMQGLTRVLSRVGQQSLAVFASSIVLARILGAVLNALGSGFWAALFINVLGFFCIYAIANIAAFSKSEPWKKSNVKNHTSVEEMELKRPAPKLMVVK
jgi:multisubunit Na+/H+ antiporter MnhG subunit